MLEVTYSMLALTAVLLFPALVQYFLRMDEVKAAQQELQEQVVEQELSLQQHEQQQQLDESVSLPDDAVSHSGNDTPLTRCSSIGSSSSVSHCETGAPQSPASVFYVSFDCDSNNNADLIKDGECNKTGRTTNHPYRNNNKPFTYFPPLPPPDYYDNGSDESDESLLEANQPEEFHKLLSQTGSEMLRSCLSIEDLVQAKIKHE